MRSAAGRRTDTGGGFEEWKGNRNNGKGLLRESFLMDKMNGIPLSNAEGVKLRYSQPAGVCQQYAGFY